MDHATWFAALAGLLAGLTHALAGPDHLSAVAPLVVGERRSGWGTGLLWGIGHSVGVWMMGLLALALRDVLPLERVSSWSERMVGAVLIAVGLWGLRKAFAPRLQEEAAHHHAHSSSRRGLAALWIGGIHGLAGSSHILGLFPALALSSRASSLAYMGGFGLGAIVAMVAFASVLSLAAVRLAAFGDRGYQALLGGASAFSIVLGGFWLMS
ncbi:MAG TPA: High-affinity nickel transporter [Thermoanaerobaculia bacterium]|nr:High-affinity nickel transporter [Thermoanaerobaculia bacterium]